MPNWTRMCPRFPVGLRQRCTRRRKSARWSKSASPSPRNRFRTPVRHAGWSRSANAARRPGAEWRRGPGWQEWAAARAPVVAARRRALAVAWEQRSGECAVRRNRARMVDRPGGYTRILRLATPRLGDAGTRAILEFTGMNDRAAKVASAPRPVAGRRRRRIRAPAHKPVAADERRCSERPNPPTVRTAEESPQSTRRLEEGAGSVPPRAVGLS